jgi:hypothetical protein
MEARTDGLSERQAEDGGRDRRRRTDKAKQEAKLEERQEGVVQVQCRVFGSVYLMPLGAATCRRA